MTNQEILTKAIEGAIAGGFDPPMEDWKVFEDYIYGKAHGGSSRIWINDLIYAHSFARALWGNGNLTTESDFGLGGGDSVSLLKNVPAWEHHLQQMVIADNPIAYLGEHLI